MSRRCWTESPKVSPANENKITRATRGAAQMKILRAEYVYMCIMARRLAAIIVVINDR